VRIPEGGTPGWWTANLRLGVTRSHVRFGLTFENLGNETYKYHGSGIYGAGTNARIFAEASL
jgi:outer membrane receptor protein involved in Fe transport